MPTMKPILFLVCPECDYKAQVTAEECRPSFPQSLIDFLVSEVKVKCPRCDDPSLTLKPRTFGEGSTDIEIAPNFDELP